MLYGTDIFKIVSKIVQGNLVVKVSENGLLQQLHFQPTGKAFCDVIETKWSYLRCDRNKVELFEFLAQQVAAKVGDHSLASPISRIYYKYIYIIDYIIYYQN